jgi:hypothetical protein
MCYAVRGCAIARVGAGEFVREVSTKPTVIAIPAFPQNLPVEGKSNLTLKLNQFLDLPSPNKVFQGFVDGLGLRSCSRFFLHESQHIIVDV